MKREEHMMVQVWKESAERYRTLLEAGQEGVVIHHNGLIMDASPGATELTGYRAEELAGMNVVDLVAEDSRPALLEMIAGGREWMTETVGLRKDGTAIFIEMKQRPIRYQGSQAFAINIRDILDRKEMEIRLEHACLENAALIMQLADTKLAMDRHSVVAITDPQGIITYVNEKFCEVSKYTREELLGQTHRIVHSGQHPREFFQELWETISAGEVWQGEIKNKAKDGSYYWNNTTIVPFLNNEGKPYQYVMVATDITEQKKINELKNEFVSMVSHELRTPLTTILGFMEILLHRDLPMEKIKKYAGMMYQEAKRLSELINDFLDLQRMESGRHEYRFTPVDVRQLVLELAEQWQGKQKHSIAVEVPDRPTYVRADDDRLRQVLHNLLSNAIKYSPDADRVEVLVQVDGKSVSIMVRDYGLGIPEEAQGKLFTKFYRVDNSDRRKIGGTGLGLAIVKEIVDAHQGTVRFSSEPGKGSDFFVELQLYEIRSMAGCIVIVEDDENLTQFIQDSLEKLDLPTVCYRSSEEAILALHSLKETEAPPKLCIVDIRLEGTQTGWDFIAELYRHPVYYETPVIVSSVLEPPRNYREKEWEKFLQKPFSSDKLLRVARHMLEWKRDTCSYIFPYQDQQALTSSLKKNGIEYARIKVDEDTIEVEVIKREGSTGIGGGTEG